MKRGRVRFLGTGTAFHDDGRGSQALWIEPGQGAPFLVDAGPTIMSAVQRLGLDAASLDRLFVTHLHGDHCAGWPFLYLHQVVLHEREEPFEIFGSIGTERCLGRLVECCYADVVSRQRFTIRYHELPVDDRSGLDAGTGVRLDTVPVEHHETSLGLRFRIPEQGTIAVSGDTRWCAGLERLSEADLLILECTSVASGPAAHVSLETLRESRGRLSAERIVLVHLTDDVARSLARDPLPGVVAAHDGLVVDL